MPLRKISGFAENFCSLVSLGTHRGREAGGTSQRVWEPLAGGGGQGPHGAEGGRPQPAGLCGGLSLQPGLGGRRGRSGYRVLPVLDPPTPSLQCPSRTITGHAAPGHSLVPLPYSFGGR